MSKQECLVLTVDGPAASGKSSLSRLLSEKLSGDWVSTGAFYRGLAFVAQEEGVSFDDEATLARLALDSSHWDVRLNPDKTRVFYHGADVSESIYSVSIGSGASQVSRFPEVRKNLLQAQRNCQRGRNLLVAEGRDCGTKVFPDAFLKIFLTASEEDRIMRRAVQSGEEVSVQSQLIRHRDKRDSGRKASPLAKAEGAFEIDSSGLTLEQVAERAIEAFQEKYRAAYKKDFQVSI